ncbi:MAG: MBL fold metallo-hydrolase [Candidatus Eisenbacteria sp.]|nr:MBL fold metallo-hydrolase [Candidatus Eisenbacteria bacterium]
MRLAVLLDNSTLIDRYLLAEPGLSFFIEDEDTTILFDAGYSNAFIANAHTLSIDLLDLSAVVLSHGHMDHTWGLVALIQLWTAAALEGQSVPTPRLVAHPLALSSRRHCDIAEIGSLLSKDKLSRHFELEFSRAPVELTERLMFLGEIPRSNSFEAQSPMGKIRLESGEEDDYILDDSALVYRSPDGLVVITGCSHAGICNIVEYARRICGEERIVDIIGGFHLLDPSESQLAGTVEYLRSVGPGRVHACHCTDLRSKIALAQGVRLEDVGVGLTLEY